MKVDFDAAHTAPRRAFVSDVHLLNPHNGALHHHGAMLEQADYDNLEMLGDVIDFESVAAQLIAHLTKNNQPLKFPSTFQEILDNVLGREKMEASLRFLDLLKHLQTDQNITINYYAGNHDNILRKLHGQTIDGINYYNDAILDIGGIPTLVEHGDKNDKYCDGNFDSTWLVKQCCRALDGSIILDIKGNRLQNSLRASFGLNPVDPTYAFSNMVKKYGKSFVSDVYQRARDRALERGARQTIMGHTHIQGVFDVSEFERKTTIHDGNYDSTYNGSTLEAVEKCVTNEPFLCWNGGDGFTNGSALYHNPANQNNGQRGFEFLDKTMFSPSKTFDLTQENPYAKYRDKTLQQLENIYQTCLVPLVDLKKGWNHAGHLTEPQASQNHHQVLQVA